MRESQGWSAYDVEELGGPSRATVVRVENGTRQASTSTLELIARALQLTTHERATLFVSAGFVPEGWSICREI